MSNFKCNFCGAEQTEAGEIVKPGKTSASEDKKVKRGPKPKQFQKTKPEPKREEEDKSIFD